MRKWTEIISLFNFCYFLLLLAACSSVTERDEAKLELDHVIIFVRDTSMEEVLQHDGLTHGVKLETTHTHQGTLGRYYIFYNTFIEFLYLNDSAAVSNNEKLFKSRYSERWGLGDDICPFGLGLIMSPFDTVKSSFPFSTYHSLDSPGDEYYLMSAHNVDQSQPLVYVSQSSRGYHKLDDLSQLNVLFEEPVRSDFRNYLSHPAGMKRLTDVIITLPTGVQGGNVAMLKRLNGIEIIWGAGYALTLVFDHESQGREIVMTDPFNLTIKY